MLVLGIVIYKSNPDEIHDYPLYHIQVLGEYNENKVLQTELDFTQKYPSNGLVKLYNFSINFPIGLVGIWEIEFLPNYKISGESYISHRVNWHNNCPFAYPIEIYRINGSSEDEKNTRNRLINGIELPFLPSKNLLISFNDCNLAIKAKETDEIGKLVTFTEQELNIGVDRYKINDIPYVSIQIGNETRYFSTIFNLPKPKDKKSYESPSFKAKKTLKRIYQWYVDNNEGIELSKRTGINVLSDFIAACREDDLITEAEGIHRLLKKGLQLDEQLQEAVNQLLDIPPFFNAKEQRIKQFISQRWEEELTKLQEEEKAHIHRLQIIQEEYEQNFQTLQQKQNSLETNINHLETQKTELQNEINEQQQRSEALLIDIDSNIQSILSNAPALLAQVALLRPFLTPSVSTQPTYTQHQTTITPGYLIEDYVSLQKNTEDIALDKPQKIIVIVRNNLIRMGIPKENALNCALWITAMGCSRVVTPLLTGSYGRIIATAVSIANGAKTPTFITFTGSPITFKDLDATIQSQDKNTIVMLEGIELTFCESLVLPILRRQAYLKTLGINQLPSTTSLITPLVLHVDNSHQPYILPDTMFDYCLAIDIDPYITTNITITNGPFYQAVPTIDEIEVLNIEQYNNEAKEFLDKLNQYLKKYNIYYSQIHISNLSKVIAALLTLDNLKEEQILKMMFQYHISFVERLAGRYEQLIRWMDDELKIPIDQE